MNMAEIGGVRWGQDEQREQLLKRGSNFTIHELVLAPPLVSMEMAFSFSSCFQKQKANARRENRGWGRVYASTYPIILLSL